MKKLNLLKTIVIVHGKSEKIICQHIKRKLRFKMEIISDKNGGKAIQINGLKNILNNTIFKSKVSFLKKFDDIDDDFKIFIIMDTDDCTGKEKENFINKEMFKNHWAYDYIVPIYNSPDLEYILTNAKVPFKTIGDKRKKEYIKLFPIDDNYTKTDVVQIEELVHNLSKVKTTNLEEFLKYCLKESE